MRLQVPGARGVRTSLAGPSCAGLVLLSMACVSGEAGPAWAGSVDTLPDGRISIRSPEIGSWEQMGDAPWRLVEELRIGSIDAEGPDAFGSIAGLDVDARGRIYVLDRQARELRAFDDDGGHVRTMGGEGGGPGEFGDPIGVALDPMDRLLVVDVGNGRYSRFDTAGVYLGAVPRPVGGYSVPARVGFDLEGRFLEGALAQSGDAYGQAILRWDTAFARVDTFRIPDYPTDEFELVRGEMRMTADVPFAPTLVWALDVRGRYWTAITDRMRFVEHALEGDTLRVIERDSEPIPTRDEDRERAIRGLEWFTRQGGRVDPSRIPDERPQLAQVAVSPDGYLWVRATPVTPGVANRFDIYDPGGRYLGAVATELGFHPAPVVRGDRVYGVISDSLGVSYVVRARIMSGG